VHFSTDQVFDGKTRSPRVENDSPSPLNHYARTKLIGEEAALKFSNALVIRIQWLYGEKKNRFHMLRDRTEFTPFNDQFGSPTWSKEVAVTTAELLRLDASGLFHFAYDDYASWADVFAFVKTELRLGVKLNAKRTDEVSLPAARPLFSVMSNRKLVKFLGRDGLGSWKDPLRRFLHT
jgi:dTDP-4-dehydrorhamnose reductase